MNYFNVICSIFCTYKPLRPLLSILINKKPPARAGGFVGFVQDCMALTAASTMAVIMRICEGVALSHSSYSGSDPLVPASSKESASKYPGDALSASQMVTNIGRLGIFVPASICRRYVGLILQASASFSPVSPFSFLAVLIRWPRVYLKTQNCTKRQEKDIKGFYHRQYKEVIA